MSDGVPVTLRPKWRAAVAPKTATGSAVPQEDLDAVAEAFTALVGDPLTVSDHVRAAPSYALGVALATRFERESRSADLDDAVEMFQAGVEATPVGSADRPDYLSALGNALGIRYEPRGRVEDLLAGTDAVEEAVKLLPPRCRAAPGLAPQPGRQSRRQIRGQREPPRPGEGDRGVAPRS